MHRQWFHQPFGEQSHAKTAKVEIKWLSETVNASKSKSEKWSEYLEIE